MLMKLLTLNIQVFKIKVRYLDPDPPIGGQDDEKTGTFNSIFKEIKL